MSKQKIVNMLKLCSVTRQFYIRTLICILWSRCEVGNSMQTDIEVSSRLISSLCALHSKFQDDKEIASEPLKSIPQGLPLLDTNCDTWVRTCRDADCETWSLEKESKCKYTKERGARIVGGEDAELGDAPWDIHLRHIYDWGSTRGDTKKFTKDEIATNNVARIKEQFRCTGIFYTKNVVITSAICAALGYRFARSRNRFVGWLARRRFLVQTWCIIKSDVNPKATCDIQFRPEFGTRGYEATIERYEKGEVKRPSDGLIDHDIAIVKFHTAFNFKSLPHTRAILFAQQGMEFQGKAIFAGWGVTNDSFTDLSIVSGGASAGRAGQITKLQKIDLMIIPFEPKCKTLVHMYLKRGAVNLDPNYDYSQRYICAEPADGTKQGLCGGDYGGALVCEKDGKQYVCGVKNTWGITVDCLKDGEGMEIFLKTSYYTPWIQSEVGNQSHADLYP